MNKALIAVLLMAVPASAELPAGLTDDDRQQIERDLKQLDDRLRTPRGDADLRADVEVFRKGVAWAMRYETKLETADIALVKKALRRGFERASTDKPTWPSRKGKLVRGYVSAIDGSVQPFGLIVPGNYDPEKMTRLDVVLHGSTKPVGLSELRFMNRFDEGDGLPAKPAPDWNYIELHPLGRVENCYRWAGETDVFEAIAAVRRQYKIDPNRIVLRGMSMGASGTWHLGLHHPDRFVAIGPYCGYVDTYNFSRTPLKNFVVVDKLPPHQEAALHIYDAIDYAANAGVVPAIACMGEKDIFFQAHVLMGRAMENEGLKMANIISPGTGHVIDPVTHAEQMRRIGEYATKGLDRAPKRVRFVTWTLKYDRCHWIRVLGLKEHYQRSEIHASLTADGTVSVAGPTNVTRFAVQPPNGVTMVRVGGADVALPKAVNGAVIGLRDGKWAYLGEPGKVALPGKRPGLQGPIDDAFTTPFLCVRGTGKPWNPAVQAWADANLKQFAAEWHHYFRGELPIKDDKDVADGEGSVKNLILFGDPGSNSLLARMLPKLPVTWTKEEVRFGGQRYSAAEHVPVMIQPNPEHNENYVVLNSGHTFREKELATINYLLFPRLGDWAVLKVAGKTPANEEVIRAGFFDENWQPKVPVR